VPESAESVSAPGRSTPIGTLSGGFFVSGSVLLLQLNANAIRANVVALRERVTVFKVGVLFDMRVFTAYLFHYFGQGYLK
jgi:hypothetical protein